MLNLPQLLLVVLEHQIDVHLLGLVRDHLADGGQQTLYLVVLLAHIGVDGVAHGVVGLEGLHRDLQDVADELQLHLEHRLLLDLHLVPVPQDALLEVVVQDVALLHEVLRELLELVGLPDHLPKYLVDGDDVVEVVGVAPVLQALLDADHQAPRSVYLAESLQCLVGHLVDR